MDTTLTRETYTENLTESQRENLLTPQDRCDLCGGQAYYIASHDAGTLLFCRHHFNEHDEGLTEAGFRIVDQSFLLTTNTKPYEKYKS